MKLPFTFSLKLVFRLLLPGFVLSLGIFPVLQTCLDALNVEIPSTGAFLLCVIVTGWLFVILDRPIYMLFQGRRYWPNKMRDFFVNQEEKRKDRLWAAFKQGDMLRKREISVELRGFPINEETEDFEEAGGFEAWFPTRLGNLMASYEGYPKRVYGMDSAFYWYRLWLKLDKDQREEIDHQQAVADSSVFVAASLYCVGMLALLYSAIRMVEDTWQGSLKQIRALVDLLPGTWVLLGVGALSILSGFLLYRASLQRHREFGEVFKSIFDINIETLGIDPIINQVAVITKNWTLTKLSLKEKYEIAWRYLHNYKIDEDGVLVPVPEFKGQGEDVAYPRALRDRILAKEIEAQGADSEHLEAQVVAVGTGKLDNNGHPIALIVEAGDQVLVARSSVARIMIGDEEFLALREADVLAITARSLGVS